MSDDWITDQRYCGGCEAIPIEGDGHAKDYCPNLPEFDPANAMTIDEMMEHYAPNTQKGNNND